VAGGATFGSPVRVPCSAPHGPARLQSGDLFYLGTATDHHNDAAAQLPAGDTSHRPCSHFRTGRSFSL
jgi:hypothetical protein